MADLRGEEGEADHSGLLWDNYKTPGTTLLRSITPEQAQIPLSLKGICWAEVGPEPP